MTLSSQNQKLHSIDTTETKGASTILTVSGLTYAIKQRVEAQFSAVQVQGEISNFKPTSSGHLYFDLKDAGAKLPCVLFKNQAQNLSRTPKEGDHVILKGSLSVYPPHGRYQLIATTLQYVGVGELLLKLEELKRKLEKAGFFDPSTKKNLPPFPKTIGVVTSQTGAVIQDIIQILKRRDPGCHILLYPVRVQGVEAAGEIASAIKDFNRFSLADVLIVGRGGGSLEDLWPFNEEIVAAAIFESRIPIVSAVGHETDFTIADLVADLRAPTPSAAAEIVSAHKVALRDSLKKMEEGFVYTLSHHLKRHRERLFRFTSHPLFSNPYSITSPLIEQVEELSAQLSKDLLLKIEKLKLAVGAKERENRALSPITKLKFVRQTLLSFQKRVVESGSKIGQLQQERLKQLTNHLYALDPRNVLKRGYAILFSQKEGSVIVSREKLIPGSAVKALLADGESLLRVIDDE